jgi:hypothetical protein
VWEQIETGETLREQQFQAILDLGAELQDILQEIKKLHNAYPLPEGDLATPVKSVANTPDCILDTPRKHDDGPSLCGFGDYSDEYYSDDDPDVDYTDTMCYQPGLSTRRSRASGASHHGISSQPWQ